MIPREILQKIRQIERRTNRLVTVAAAGARASARFTVLKPDAPNQILQLTSIRRLKRRERRAPARFIAHIQSVFLSALTCVLSPRRGFHSVTSLFSPIVHLNNPAAGISKEAGNVSPSPWGEGRDEAGRDPEELRRRLR